jgi:hypothetical protein
VIFFFEIKALKFQQMSGWLDSVNGLTEKLSNLTAGDEETKLLKSQILELEERNEKLSLLSPKLDKAVEHLYKLSDENKSMQAVIESQKIELEAMRGHDDYFDMQASPRNGGVVQDGGDMQLVGEIEKLKEELHNVQSFSASTTSELQNKILQIEKEREAALAKRDEEITQLKSIMEADATVLANLIVY